MIYFFLPETAGLSLEALDNIFDCDGVTRGVLNKQHRRNMLEVSRQQLSDNTAEGSTGSPLDTKGSMTERIEC